jgi:reductive dehalogenase
MLDSVVRILYLLVGGFICLFFVLFTISSVYEKKPRAIIISIIIMLVIGLVWFGWYILFAPSNFTLAIPLILFGLTVILFFAPLCKSKQLIIGYIDKKVDERDVIFAREEYEVSSDKYEKYYAMRPEYKDIDDKLRKLPELLEPGGRYYDPIRSEKINSIFRDIEALELKVDGEVNQKQARINSDGITAKIKNMVLRLGADDVGVAKLNPKFVYSHVGRGPEKWGTPIKNEHRFAIAFTCEMNYTAVETAPGLPITEESAVKYLKAAQISITLAKYIRSLGYPARAHIAGSNYQIMLPPVAHDAGLGELGRIGYLISPKFGSRIRLGAVTTDLPLKVDKPIEFGVQDFCEKCMKCAENCPSGAIPGGKKVNVKGVEKWPLNVEQCLHYWRMIGTDCGLCMKVCPYSHPPTLVHNLVRYGISHSSFARTVSLRGDDLFYGRKSKYERI